MSLSLYQKTSFLCSKLITNYYSTSFSIGIRFLHKNTHNAIYGIYGFVRVADEIVDTFHEYDKKKLLEEFKEQTFRSIEEKISTNPILNSFQQTVNYYNIEHSLMMLFFKSMEMDLDNKNYEQNKYESYILGSAEVVGLMCLRVFVDNNENLYTQLKPTAMKLGAAFQKINFLRDIKQDWQNLGRSYFPNIQPANFSQIEKTKIEIEIEIDFKEALKGIKQLPSNVRLGVYIAYIYYYGLFNKIKRIKPEKLLTQRMRISSLKKIILLLKAIILYKFNKI